MWTIFKGLIEFVAIELLFLWFGPRGSWAPSQGGDLCPCIGTWALSHGTPGKFPCLILLHMSLSYFFFCPKYVWYSLLCQGIMNCMAFFKLLGRILCCGMCFPLPRLPTGRSSDCFWLCSYRQAAGSILDMACDPHESSRKNFPVNTVSRKSVVCACRSSLSKHLPDSPLLWAWS